MAEGFIVEEFTSKITPPKSLTAMIDAKNAAIQSALKAENEVKEAEANAKIAVAKAEGNAKAMKIKADAESYYNKTIAASLSPMIVQARPYAQHLATLSCRIASRSIMVNQCVMNG